MRLLFVKLKHIGDSLLLTPTLDAVRTEYPNAEIWVVIRESCDGIMAGCKSIDRLLTAAPPEKDRRSAGPGDFQVAWSLRKEQFDFAFELGNGDRGRLLATLSGAKIKAGWFGPKGAGFPWRWIFQSRSSRSHKGVHAVERDFQTVSDALPLSGPIPPLHFTPEMRKPWALLPADFSSPYVVLHPCTRWQRKRWTNAGWRTLIERFLDSGISVILSSGPDPSEFEEIRLIQKGFDSRVIATLGRTGWDELAWLLGSARLFVGVDTAAMHLAAACACPTVALFGPSKEEVWQPWKVPHSLVFPAGDRAEGKSLDQLRTSEISVEDVWSACEQMLAHK